MGEEKIYVNFFHNHSKTHYHFLWHIKERRIIGVKPDQPKPDGNDNPVSCVLECSIKNFPYKCFYNAEKGQIYSFYR